MHNCEMEYKKVDTLEYYKCKICGKFIDAGTPPNVDSPGSTNFHNSGIVFKDKE